MVAKQQLQTHGKRATPYDHVKPRVQTVRNIILLTNNFLIDFKSFYL